MLEQRAEQGLPPHGHLLMMRSDCKDAETGDQFLRTLRGSVEPQLPAGVQLIGPLPAPMQRRAGRFRSQMLVRGGSRRAIQHTAAMLVSTAQQQKASQGLNWSIDVDPQDLF